jgi:hypothetical protein
MRAVRFWPWIQSTLRSSNDRRRHRRSSTGGCPRKRCPCLSCSPRSERNTVGTHGMATGSIPCIAQPSLQVVIAAVGD